MRVVLRDIRVSKDCFYRTLRDTCITIDASIGIDVKAVRQFMKRFNRANGSTIGVFAVNA
jgi:hypothetical protein